MKTEKNLWLAFGLNLFFSIFEFFGGMLTGSVAIVSDAIHDLSDAAGIGIACFMERKSKRPKDSKYTYGYSRYSVLGGAITTVILLVGAVAMIIQSVKRLFTPAAIHYDGMLLFAVVGVAVNFVAALVTRHGASVNQRAINLHMLEDILGWVVVLVGALIMRLTDFVWLDPMMSIGVSLFIGIHAMAHLVQILDVLLEKSPAGIAPDTIRDTLLLVGGVEDVHHIHLWSMDDQTPCATMHIVTDRSPQQVKARIRLALAGLGIEHVTLELEGSGEPCAQQVCHPRINHSHCCHH